MTFGVHFQQPGDFYSTDRAQEQLRSDADNQLDDHIESSITQHGLVDDLPDMPALMHRMPQAVQATVMPSAAIRYTQAYYRAPPLLLPDRPPAQNPAQG